jgi:formyltetrahydrofolate synthetase
MAYRGCAAASREGVMARGLIISAPRSGSGKTTVTLGLLAALRGQGVAVTAAKAGRTTSTRPSMPPRREGPG